MLGEENAATVRDWADAVRKLESELRETVVGRDAAIRHALRLGTGVNELVTLTGLTRARVYQIRDAG